ncbi:hypothetical protein ACLOJK_015325, partial [Asimina triloba]
CDGIFNAHGVGRRRGSLWMCHAVVDIADMLNGEQQAAGERGGGRRARQRALRRAAALQWQWLFGGCIGVIRLQAKVDTHGSNSWLDNESGGVAMADVGAASGLQRGCGLTMRRCGTSVKGGLVKTTVG